MKKKIESDRSKIKRLTEELDRSRRDQKFWHDESLSGRRRYSDLEHRVGREVASASDRAAWAFWATWGMLGVNLAIQLFRALAS